ncbi:hypothetical protein AU156_gp155 [Edwardsiella phage PEi20]|uniref:Uncharacterized protein n=2 Tax=Kanagawavirus pei20 TaxID=2844109 RepID=A0A0B6VLU4_9CAUD|nr:hypothetical protein AU156_gp155 [Edwardsiella phage PEi20]BAQ22947.1 conserved hypothetical protein [Edwardsiella phage PEi20]BAQ23247.1 conserved hypothetical protein [Edwardsiella phage PEi26]
MIKVTIMVWFELENGEPRFKDWDDWMFPWQAQETAKELAALNYNGSCKIFDCKTSMVIGSAGFE